MTTGDRPTLATLPAAFERARGDAADRAWAERVIGRFSLDGVNRTLVADELTGVLALVRESGEGPAELFGEPADYVETQTDQWRAGGAPLEPAEPSTSWWDVPGLAAAVASVVAVMLAILEVAAGNWTTTYTLGKVLLPALTGVTALVSITTFETLLMRTRRRWAIAGALAVAGVGGSAILAAVVLGNDHPVLTGSVGWYAALVAVHVLAAVALFRVVPDGDAVRARQRAPGVPAPGRATPDDGGASPATVLSDDEWAAQLAGVLRLRVEMPESAVRQTIAEARQHAATNGTSLAQEFGPPRAYASRLPRSTSGRRTWERWRRAAWAVAVPVSGVLAFEGLRHGWEWGNVRWVMVIVFAAACVTVAGFLRDRRPSA
ncbi:hypothetical protein [Georgenia faecalis]|uniref:DUF1129 family protein n=1 Tax=Georgenia faecalis TaxID=2483799 RepID=A0ABV9D6M7_9MICO|nr:hypothetical protein [Georgenia faecalis]